MKTNCCPHDLSAFDKQFYYYKAVNGGLQHLHGQFQ